MGQRLDRPAGVILHAGVKEMEYLNDPSEVFYMTRDGKLRSGRITLEGRLKMPHPTITREPAEGQQQATVFRHLDVLKTSLANLDELTATLADRLKLVSQNPAVCKEPGEQEQPGGSLLSQKIVEASAHVQLLKGRVADIISNLEI